MPSKVKRQIKNRRAVKCVNLTWKLEFDKLEKKIEEGHGKKIVKLQA